MLAQRSPYGMGSDTPTKQLDESDATSMTTTSSATPSPCSNNACLSSSADSSPSSSTMRTGRSKEDGIHDVRNSFSMISALATSPRHLQTPTEDAENAWSDSDDCDECALINEDNDNEKIKTPDKRTTSWRIQGHALFHESDDEGEFMPSVMRRSSDSITSERPLRESDSPPKYTRSSWSPSSQQQQQQPIRRSQMTPTNETEPQTPSDFIIPGHRRRNSTGKCRSSPAPHTGGRHITPVRSVQNTMPPNSLSKTKKPPRKSLELPGLSLEERLSLHSRSASGSSGPLSPFESPSRTSLRMWLCRIRLTTFIWGLVIIGCTILGKTAMIASESASRLQASSSKVMLQPPTGGLRGSLLMTTVGRTGQSHSTDHTAKRHSQEKKKKPKVDANADKHATKHNNHKKEKATNNNHKKEKAPPPKEALPLKPRSVVHPKPLGVRRVFEDQDTHMYASPSTLASTSIPKKTVVLHDDVVETPSYEVEQYPAEFTDNTQFYGELDSSDERLQRMELRDPYDDGECVPMQDWQTTYHPSCNGVHELGVEYLGEHTAETDFKLFGTKGYWRYAWRLDLRRNGHVKTKKEEDSYEDTVVLKTLKFQHNFEDAHFEHDRIDAVAMERLTSSPHVINVFGFCGHSVLTEYADGPRLGELADKSRHQALARLRIARDIANGLADVHGIDAPDGSNATFVHLDINPANVISIGGTLKLNDFNIGIIRRWNTTSQEPCGFPAQYPNPQWRSPEEAREENSLTEKVDVFSMGHIFFRLICGHEPWNKLEPGGKPSKEVIDEKVKKGMLPSIPEAIMNTKDPEVAAIRDVMIECYRADPKDRPTAREITTKLEAVLEKLAAKEENSRRHA